MWTFPLSRYLVPAVGDAAPEGFTLVESQVAGGLPHYVELNPRHRLKLTLPTGLARQWLDADPQVIISTSSDQSDPFDPAAPEAPMGQSPRITLIRDGIVIGATALALAPPRRFPPGETAAAIEVRVMAWRLRAGVMQGASGDSFIRLAWKAADEAIAEFGPPPTNEFVVRRWPVQLRIESLIQRRLSIRYRGHLLKTWQRHEPR